MKLLGVESATLSGGVALLDGDCLLGEITLNIAITHSERLMSAVDRLLADCGLDAAGIVAAVQVRFGHRRPEVIRKPAA